MAPALFHRRRLLHALLGAAGLAAIPPQIHGKTDSELQLLAYGALRPTGQRVEGLPVGGLSGLAWDERSDLWYALSDDRGRHGPVRCFVMRLPGLRQGHALVPQWQGVITLRDESGRPLAPGSVDPEGLALRHDPVADETTLIWCSEGDVRHRLPPAIFESALDGSLLRRFSLPPLLRELGHADRGPRPNRTLEGVALTPDGRHLWAAMEGALTQDVPPGQADRQSGPCRITRFDVASGQADRQIAYPLDAAPFGPSMPQGPRVNGISELLVAGPERLWLLERAFSLTSGFRVRLYEADLTGASDTLAVDSLQRTPGAPARKRLLLDLHQAGLPHVDNLEAMSWGPRSANGYRTVVLASDDNFHPLQTTQFAAFEWNPSAATTAKTQHGPHTA